MPLRGISAFFLLTFCWMLRAQSDAAFPREVYAARRARVLAQMSGGVAILPGKYLVGDGGLGKQDSNFWYLTGVESPYAILVMSARRTVLFLPAEFQFAGGQYPMSDEVFRRAKWNLPVRRLAPGAAASAATGIAETLPIDSFASELPKLTEGASVVYMPAESGSMYAPPGLTAPRTPSQQFVQSVSDKLPGKRIANLTPLIASLRLVKDSYEVAALRRAAEISVKGFDAAMAAIRPGVNDREIAGLMEYTWKREGSARASFAPIVGSGENGFRFFTLMAENYNSVNHVMQAGELVFIDYGAAEFQTYTSDLCRTYPVSGKFTAEQRKYYDIVLAAQDAAIRAMKPGVYMLDVIKAAASVFRAHDLEPYEDIRRMGPERVWGIMPSPTHYLARNAGITEYSPQGRGVRDIGHHIGLDVHDSRDWSKPLAAGMVITVEPKIYIPEKGIAIMIEDMILITPNGSENLSAGAPKKADDIERAMRKH